MLTVKMHNNNVMLLVEEVHVYETVVDFNHDVILGVSIDHFVMEYCFNDLSERNVPLVRPSVCCSKDVLRMMCSSPFFSTTTEEAHMCVVHLSIPTPTLLRILVLSSMN